MIERFYLKEFLSFTEAQLEFKSGLVVFTGPSGSGKSILMRSILASVGLDNVEASICESSVTWHLDEEQYGIINELPNIFRQVKKEKTSYFINNQRTSKSAIETISRGYLRHLSLKNYTDFEPSSLMNLVDAHIAHTIPSHRDDLVTYQTLYATFKKEEEHLNTLEAQEKKLLQLKEFAEFEIGKIDAIHPTIGEDEELQKIKKQLSKKEKIHEAIQNAQAIFRFESSVSAALSLLEKPSVFFDDAMNELRHLFEGELENLELLEEVSVEEILDRIEHIAQLKRRYGGIQEALDYRQQKVLELESYQTIETSKTHLHASIAKHQKQLSTLAKTLSKRRKTILPTLHDKLNGYLSMLYLRNATLTVEPIELSAFWVDRVVLGLEGTQLDKLSSGEFNRLRLALLALKVECMEGQGGVLMLDEIDANLSGEESMSVAKVLRHLSKNYQIFVISHQPQLTSMGDQHFLVYKEDQSRVRELSHEERIEEIARIISGEAIGEEARGFAQNLLKRGVR